MDTALALRVILAKKRKSQAWLARETGLTRSYISNLCNPEMKCRPSFDAAERFSAALEVPLSEFIRGGEEE